MQNNCPVCNKAGVADYTSQHIICPQCNSDLKPFLLLHSISKPKAKKNNLFLIFAVSLTAIIFAFLYFNSNNENKNLIANNSQSVLQLKDSIRDLKTNINSTLILQTVNTIPAKEIVILYKVKRGDYPSKIAEFFYNNWRMYKKIEADNNLQQPYTLKIGQPLTIKLKQE